MRDNLGILLNLISEHRDNIEALGKPSKKKCNIFYIRRAGGVKIVLLQFKKKHGLKWLNIALLKPFFWCFWFFVTLSGK